jgi:hypothetical protein
MGAPQNHIKDTLPAKQFLMITVRGSQGSVRSVAKTKRTPKRLALGLAIDSSVKNEQRA